MPAQTTTVKIGSEEYTFDSKKEMLKHVGATILGLSDQPMTLRQLYYQFVGYDLIDNKVSQYQYLSEAMVEARLEGIVPWSDIEDRTRSTDAGDWNDGLYVEPDDRFENNLEWFVNTPDRYHRPRWMGQKNYIEVWVEKAALAGIFEAVCDDLKVVSYPNSGYSSVTLLHEAAERIKREMWRDSVSPPGAQTKRAHILYFGDYDPSGVDIERNIREKLQDTFDVDVSVHRVALTREQIDDFELPPQPAKATDARYEDFVAEHGDMAVELDALPVEELRRLIRDSVDAYFDGGYYEKEILEGQEAEREWLREWRGDVLDDDGVSEWLDGY